MKTGTPGKMLHQVRHHVLRACIPALTVATLALAGQPSSAFAASTITVTTTADEINTNGKCSLREAIAAANTNQAVDSCAAGGDGEDIIKLGTGTYKLTRLHQDNQPEVTGDWNLTSDLVIKGNGSSKTIIDADRKDRVFFVDANRVTLEGMTLQRGKTRDSYSDGGGISMQRGILMMGDIVITTSDGYAGGGLFVERGASVLLNRSTVSYNDAVEGGGVYNRGSIDIQSTVFRGNDTRLESPTDINGDVGGAIRNLGELSLSQSTVDANMSGFGGGIANSGQEYRAFIYKSTFSNNRATLGGGVYNSSAAMLIVDSTISGNQATENGGGLLNVDYNCFPGCPGVTQLDGVTIANNTADSDKNGTGDGGGIFNETYEDGNRVRFANTIIGKNTDSGNQTPGCAGSISSYGYNIIASTKGCTIRNTNEGNKLNVDPKLAALNNNGGPTKTHALNSGSPAIDAANPSTTDLEYGCFGSDQRNVSRPQDGNNDKQARCDIGAYERTPSGNKASSAEISTEASDVPSVAPVQTAVAVEEPIVSDPTTEQAAQ